MYAMICQCIKMAVSQKMSSIAFPTIGCGKLGFDPAVVAECFLQAEKDINSLIKVHDACNAAKVPVIGSKVYIFTGDLILDIFILSAAGYFFRLLYHFFCMCDCKLYVREM